MDAPRFSIVRSALPGGEMPRSPYRREKSMALSVATKQKALNAFVVSPVGRIDSNTAPSLEKELDKLLVQSATVIAMNMEGVDYISSAGIRVLVKTAKGLKKMDGKMVYMHLQPQVKKVFEIINALPSMKIFSSFDEMDEYLDTIQKSVLNGGSR
jgi:anti-anti-sigma factor